MKQKKFAAYAVLFALAAGLTAAGCGGKAAAVPAQAAQPAAETQAAPSDGGTGAYITEEAAKRTALDHAGLRAEDVTFTKVKLDRDMDGDDGGAVYEVEFYSGGTEYDYDVDAATGKVRSFDYDGETAAHGAQGETGSMMTGEEAKAIALKDAGVAEADVSYMHVELDADHGRAKYEVEFYSGGTEYDYDVDAATGEIWNKDFDAESGATPAAGADTGAQGETGSMTEEEAKATALKDAGFQESQVTRLRVKKERDDGRVIFKVEFYADRAAYSYDIDPASGRILERDVDRD